MPIPVLALNSPLCSFVIRMLGAAAVPFGTVTWLVKVGAILLPAIAALALMSALTMLLTVRALLSFVGVTVSPEVNVYA